MSLERIRAVHWVFDHVLGFTYKNWDDFKCAVDQKEASLMGWS